MTQVLVLGGTGRIGRSIAQDLLTYTNAKIILAGRRSPLGQALAGQMGARTQFLALDLADRALLQATIAGVDLVIHSAGPFAQRDDRVLQTCINQGVNYLDVSDNPDFVHQSLGLQSKAVAAGITAIVSTGIFPGISNSMARLAIEALDQPETLQLNYVVVGSGGAGPTVMRTTFLEISHPFQAWVQGQWQTIQPYSQREKVTFPPPYGDAAVYWFSTSEAATLPQSFPLKTVITKFGSLPDWYNPLTQAMTLLPPILLQQPWLIEFLAQVSYGMTQVSDRWTGIGIAMQAKVIGQYQGRSATAQVSFAHPHMLPTVGCGTGSIAQLILAQRLQKPGVWPVEQVLPSPLFLETLTQRRLEVMTQFPGG